jgi:prevent-host-death family protein
MPTQTVNVEEAKTHLADLLQTASEGGEIIIVDNGKPLARLIPARDFAVYESHPPMNGEFSSDDESLAWDADGWENVA